MCFNWHNLGHILQCSFKDKRVWECDITPEHSRKYATYQLPDLFCCSQTSLSVPAAWGSYLPFYTLYVIIGTRCWVTKCSGAAERALRWFLAGSTQLRWIFTHSCDQTHCPKCQRNEKWSVKMISICALYIWLQRRDFRTALLHKHWHHTPVMKTHWECLADWNRWSILCLVTRRDPNHELHLSSPNSSSWLPLNARTSK